MRPSSDPVAVRAAAVPATAGAGRSWPGLAAVGAGLIHLGVAATAEPLVLVVLVLTGAAEAGWGIAALSRARPPVPRGAFAAAVLLVAAWIATLLSAGGEHAHDAVAASAAASATSPALPLGAMAGAGLLDLAVAVVLAVPVRGGARPRSGEPTPLRFLLGTAAGAGVVAVVTATSLAGLTAGASHLH